MLSLHLSSKIFHAYSFIIQGILRLRGRPSVAYDQQGLVFAVAMEGGAIKLFDSRSYDKVCIEHNTEQPCICGSCVKYLSCQSIQFQGPFDTFLVGGDTAEVSDIKFSNDGKSMLLTTTNNHIYVLDAYGGDKLSYIIFPFSVLQIPILVVHIF